MSKVSSASSYANRDASNTVYIYNVKHKLFLSRGDIWGTEAVLNEVGMPFAVQSLSTSNGVTTCQFTTAVSSSSGNSLHYTDASGNTHDHYNYFVDNSATSFTLTRATDVVGSDRYAYRISCSVTSAKSTYEMPGSSTQHSDANVANGTYYMRGGAKNDQTGSTTAISAELAVNGFTETASDGSDEWIFVTLAQRQDYIKNTDAKSIEAVPASFLIDCHDFAKNATNIGSWKTGSGTSTALTINGTTKTPPSSSTTTSYYVGAGVTVDVGNKQYGGLYTANIHGASGSIHQSVTPLKAGWYEARVNAFTTGTAGTSLLYASVGGADKASTLNTEYDEAAIQKITAPSSYVDAENTVNSYKGISSDGDMRYNYQSIVRVYVPESSATTGGLTIGVKVANGGNSDWTCIDNFELYYLGNIEKRVILDEQQTSVDYMTKQVDSDKQATVVYLNRTLTAGKWNSLVLPITMERNDIIHVFGSGTHVCELTGATNEKTPNTIYFDEVDEIEAGKLYIIKPTKEMDSPAIAATSTTDGLGVSFSTADKYYSIQNVYFDGTFTDRVEGKSAAESYGGNQVMFAGTYIKKEDVIPANSYILYAGETDVDGSTGSWKHRLGTSSSRAFRGWLEVKGGSLNGAKELNLCIDGIEDGTTSIDGIPASTARATDAHVYNLCGQQVASDATQLGTLPSGLYIVGGKKVLVK